MEKMSRRGSIGKLLIVIGGITISGLTVYFVSVPLSDIDRLSGATADLIGALGVAALLSIFIGVYAVGSLSGNKGIISRWRRLLYCALAIILIAGLMFVLLLILSFVIFGASGVEEIFHFMLPIGGMAAVLSYPIVLRYLK